MAYRKLSIALFVVLLVTLIFDACKFEAPNPAPRISVNSPKEGATFRKGSRLPLNMAVNDADGVSQVTVTTSTDKTNIVLGTLIFDGGGAESLVIDSAMVFDTLIYPLASYYLTTEATDVSGNSKKVSVKITVVAK